jgi:glycosyltransferase involved in cell wall biosynthesis
MPEFNSGVVSREYIDLYRNMIMTETVCLNNKYSTTKLLSKVKPPLEFNKEDQFESLFFLPENSQRLGEGGLRTKGYFKSSNEKKTLISIITVVYNGEEYLEETILSVLNQDYDNVEYIIIDGGSTDDTLNIIKKYEDRVDYWVSEKDKGISDAFNKGISCCFGELIGLINSDDYYEEKAFQSVVNTYFKNRLLSESVIYGQTNRITVDGVKQVKKSSKLSWCLSVPFSHCSSFLTNSYYKKYGLFNTKFKIAMDVDLLMRGVKSADYIEINDFTATQRDGGVSDTCRLEGYKEYMNISRVHFGLVLSYLGYITKLMVFYKNKVFK